MPLETSTSRTQVRVLHFTCSHCGSVRHFRCEPMPNSLQLERVTKNACRECGGHGGAVSIILYDSPIPYQLAPCPKADCR